MKKSVLKKYAQLIAEKGVNIQKGQEVMVHAGLDQPEFVKLVVEACYKAGAAKVTVEWDYQPLAKVHVRCRSQKVLNRIEEWEKARLQHRVDTLPAMIYLDSDDPDGSSGINQVKLAKSQQAKYPILKSYRDQMENRYQWCIAAVPGVAWAKKVFPGLSKTQAVEKLWEAILTTSRVDEDPVAAWDAHNADLAARCAYLNSLGLTSLHYAAGNGTDFTVGLIPDALFMGGQEVALGSGIAFNPNIPSEEVFVSPMKGVAEGIVYATKPLSYRGVLIENFSVRFAGGKVVEVKAQRNEEALRTMVAMDEGAAMLGECALVPQRSPIAESGLLFYNTLFDENAACHLALGFGFSNCLKDYEQYTLQECQDKGINDSMIHTDFMIGCDDLAITGRTADGKEVQIFKDGNWAF